MHTEYSTFTRKNQFPSILLKSDFKTVSGFITTFLTKFAATRAVIGTQITIAQLPIRADAISVTP